MKTDILQPIDTTTEVVGHTDDIYVNIQQQISKLSYPIPDPVNWNTVAEDSVLLLKDHIKDFNVAHYLVLAELETDGVESLFNGIEFLRQFVARFWNEMRPPRARVRARENSVNWFFANLLMSVERRGAWVCKSGQFTDLKQLIESYVKDIQELLDRQINPVRELLSRIEAVVRFESDSVAEEGSTTQEVMETSTTVPQESAPVEQITKDAAKVNIDPKSVSIPTATIKESVSENSTPSDNTAILRRCRDDLANLAGAKLAEDITDPTGYYLRRTSAWLTLQRLPEAGTNNITPLSAPAKRDIQSMLDAWEADDYTAAIHCAEALVERYPLWLEANAYCIKSLQQLGTDSETAVQCIRSLVTDLLTRFPKLSKIKFSNGEKMFGSACSGLLLAARQPTTAVGHVASTGNKSVADDANPELDALIGIEAEQSFENFASGLQAYRKAYNRAVSDRERCTIRMRQIDYCSRLGQYSLALAQIDALWNKLTNMEFEAWEPQLATTLLSLHIQALLAKGSEQSGLSDNEKVRCRQLFQQLTELDVCAASELDTSRFE